MLFLGLEFDLKVAEFDLKVARTYFVVEIFNTIIFKFLCRSHVLVHVVKKLEDFMSLVCTALLVCDRQFNVQQGICYFMLSCCVCDQSVALNENLKCDDHFNFCYLI